MRREGRRYRDSPGFYGHTGMSSKVCFLLLILTFLPTLALGEGEPYRFGFIGPLTGTQASYGIEAKQAIELAIADRTAAGQGAKRRIEIVFEDGMCQGKEAAIAARKLVSLDHVRFILGGVCSGETLAAAAVAEQTKTILLSAFSSNPDISNAGDYVFRLSPNDRQGGEALAKHGIDRGYNRFALISENTDYSLALKDVFERTVRAASKTVTLSETFNPGVGDFRTQIIKLRGSKPDVVFLNPQGGNEAGLMVRQIRELGWQVPILGAYSFSSSDAAKAAGGRDKLSGISYMDAPEVTSSLGRVVLKRYLEKCGDIQSEYLVVSAYDTALLLIQAIERVGENPELVRDYFYGLDHYDGAAGRFKFDTNGDVVGINYVIKKVD